MKILSIGNSFSEDAQRYLHQIAKSCGDDIYCANLYIGGCSLETHYNNIKENKSDYDFQVNGEHTNEKISIKDALIREDWDYITVQQVSSFSGMIETYYPYITEVIGFAKKLRPNAEIILHQTWSYENGSDHAAFINYDCDSDKMFEKIVQTNAEVAKRENVKTVIPDGEIINALRKKKEFDYQNGGATLCRDTFHMDFVFGRYALSITWYKILSGKDVTKVSYLPPFETESVDNLKKINIIKETVQKYFE